MSDLTKFLRKPASVATDAAVSTGVATGAGILIATFFSFLPFSTIIGGAAGGVLGAMIYMRARNNLKKKDAIL